MVLAEKLKDGEVVIKQLLHNGVNWLYNRISNRKLSANYKISYKKTTYFSQYCINIIIRLSKKLIKKSNT